MSQQIEENITKILRNQNCKKNIEARLTNKKLKAGKQTINADRMELDCMLFQVVKEGILTDHMFFFPCNFELNDESKVSSEERRESENPKAGSFIRTVKMDFDLNNFSLVIYDYQYLGGSGSIVISNAAKVNWNSQTISQVIRKNNTVKGGQILLDSYVNDKGVKDPFEYPKVQFLTVRLLEKMLSDPEKETIDLNVQKIKVPKDQDEQSKNAQNKGTKIRTQQQF